MTNKTKHRRSSSLRAVKGAVKKRNPRSLANLTPWKPGQSGNPSGRSHYVVAVMAAKAILVAPIPNDPHSRTYAEGICERLAVLALEGDRLAAETLFDHAEGKPRQAVDTTAVMSVAETNQFEGWTDEALAACRRQLLEVIESGKKPAEASRYRHKT
jgi:hypothetical protein